MKHCGGKMELPEVGSEEYWAMQKAYADHFAEVRATLGRPPLTEAEFEECFQIIYNFQATLN
jgi:hypothetical protein